MIIWILLTGLLVGLIWYKFVKPLSYWKNLGVKQTNPWPVFGDLWDTIISKKRTFCEFVEWVYNLYPNDRYMGCYQISGPTLVLRDTELIKQIVIKDFDHFTDHYSFLDDEEGSIMTGNLFSLKGQKWREMRATLSGSFTSSKMKNMYHLMEEAAHNFVQYFIDKNEDIIEVEMKDTYTRYTNDVIATSAFGIKCDSLADPENEFFQMGKKATTAGGILATLRILALFIFPSKMLKVLKIPVFENSVIKFFKNIINETIKTRDEQGIVRPDMIHILMEARKGIRSDENDTVDTGFATVNESPDIGKFKHIKNITNNDIAAQALIFFFAGFETVAMVMSFGTFELVINKNVQDKLREEIKETYKTNNGEITYEVLLKMKYLDMVVSEMLRKWPPAVATDRVCTKPYTIEPVLPGEKSLTLKVGEVIWLPVQGIHRDPKNYPNPEKFDPERFSDENKDGINPYTYMPFGAGPRNCIGSRFALLEIKALLFNLLLNFEIVPIARTQIPLKLDRMKLQHTVEGGFWFGLKRIRS